MQKGFFFASVYDSETVKAFMLKGFKLMYVLKFDLA